MDSKIDSHRIFGRLKSLRNPIARIDSMYKIRGYLNWLSRLTGLILFGILGPCSSSESPSGGV